MLLNFREQNLLNKAVATLFPNDTKYCTEIIVENEIKFDGVFSCYCHMGAQLHVSRLCHAKKKGGLITSKGSLLSLLLRFISNHKAIKF